MISDFQQYFLSFCHVVQGCASHLIQHSNKDPCKALFTGLQMLVTGFYFWQTVPQAEWRLTPRVERGIWCQQTHCERPGFVSSSSNPAIEWVRPEKKNKPGAIILHLISVKVQLICGAQKYWILCLSRRDALNLIGKKIRRTALSFPCTSMQRNCFEKEKLIKNC